RVCLAGPGPRDDKQGLITTVLHSMMLFGVECSKIRLGHRCLGPNHQSHQQARISERLQIGQDALSHFESVISSLVSKWTSTQRFDEAPKLDSCLGSATVPVIAIPGAPPRGAVEATNSRSKPDMDTPSPPLLFNSAEAETGRP